MKSLFSIAIPGLQEVDSSIEDNYWEIFPALARPSLQADEEVV